MKTLKELREMLPTNSENLIVSVRELFDLKLISYSEYVVLREFVLDKNL